MIMNLQYPICSKDLIQNSRYWPTFWTWLIIGSGCRFGVQSGAYPDTHLLAWYVWKYFISFKAYINKYYINIFYSSKDGCNLHFSSSNCITHTNICIIIFYSYKKKKTKHMHYLFVYICILSWTWSQVWIQAYIIN